MATLARGRLHRDCPQPTPSPRPRLPEMEGWRGRQCSIMKSTKLHDGQMIEATALERSGSTHSQGPPQTGNSHPCCRVARHWHGSQRS